MGEKMKFVALFLLLALVSNGLSALVSNGSGLYFKPDENSLEEGVVANTKYGKIQGGMTVATNGRPIYTFKSIPFAKPPIGEFRFQAPRSLKETEDSWNGIRDGTKNPNSCAQYLLNLSPASEDCLYLNVYTPIKPGTTDKKLPVMVFIYGGAFLFGDSVIYGPNRILAHDVVLVVIHYRLGALGFLSTGDAVIPGNAGLKDQREALRWVQENIDAFNGDKNQVTLFGESAGGNSALAHLLSPSSKGLFQKVIAQSGTPLAPWAKDSHPVQSFERFAASVNCTGDRETKVNCLLNKPWLDLAEATFRNIASDLSNLKMSFEACSITVEAENEGAFFTEEPLNILRRGDYPHVPVMLGANQHEGSAVLGGAYALSLGSDGLLDDPNYVEFELIPTLLNAIDLNDESKGAPVSQTAGLSFFPEGVQRGNFTQITDGLVDFLSVFTFKAAVLRTTDYLSMHSDNVFLYSFEHEGFNSIWTLVFDFLLGLIGREPPPVKHGVMHADDLIYFWTLPFIITGNDRKFSDMVCKIWTDFAITGNPTPADDYPKWTNYKTRQPYYYKLDLEPELLLDYVKSWRLGYQ